MRGFKGRAGTMKTDAGLLIAELCLAMRSLENSREIAMHLATQEYSGPVRQRLIQDIEIGISELRAHLKRVDSSVELMLNTSEEQEP